MSKNKLSAEQKHSIIVRTITAAVLVALLVPAMIFGGIYFVSISALIAFAFAYETVHITPLQGKTRVVAFIAIIILLLGTCYYVVARNYFDAVKAGEYVVFDNFFTANFNELNLSETWLVTSAAVLFLISFFSRQFSIRYVFYFFAMIVILSLGVQSLLYLRFSPFVKFELEGVQISETNFQYFHSLALIIYVVLGVCVNDIGAFFVGILFGKHKMAPEISPKKTWEGAIGGIVISFAVTFTFAMVMGACGYPLLPQIDIHHWYWIFLISLLLPVFGDVGDFFFSSIKRSFGVKDYSSILPGHGGVLDRLDSLIFASGLVSGILMMMDFIGKISA